MNDSGNNQAETPQTDATSAGIVVNVFGRTDVGLVRDHNEDNFLIADLSTANRSIRPEVRNHMVGDRGSLFVVCDGMGGAAAGEVASKIGVDTVYEVMQEGEPPVDDLGLARRVDEAVCEAGTRIFTAAKLNRGQRGMGTTASVAALIGPRLVMGQVGDSRAHVVREGKLVQVTKDQSLVQQLIDAKQLTEEEAKDFDRSNIILQALGTTEEVHVDITSAELRRGDVLVMCSDGLSGMVEPDVIRDVTIEYPDPMDACRRLTELACEGGGDDNITVIVARFEGRELLPPMEDDVLEYAKFEYPKVTETTVRAPLSRFTKGEDSPDEPAKKAEQESAPAAAKTETAPAVEESKKAAAEATAAEAKAPEGDREPETEVQEEKKKGGAGLVIAIVLVLLVVGGVGGYLALGSGDDGGAATMQPNPAVLPAQPQPEAVPPVAPVPEPVPQQPVDAQPTPIPTPPAPVEPEEEPRLSPIDEKELVNDDDVGAPVHEKPSSGTKTGTKKKNGSKTENGSSNTGGNAEEPEKPKAEKPKKKPRPKKKKESVIDDNPY